MTARATAPLLQTFLPIDYAASGRAARTQIGLARAVSGPAFLGLLIASFAATAALALSQGAETGGAILGAAILWAGLGTGALFVPLLAGTVLALIDGDPAQRPRLLATLATVLPVAAIPLLGGSTLGAALLAMAGLA